MRLKDYTSKRTFGQTPEPKPGRRRKGGGLVFVVHKHAARALHYDLRLEMEGVLKSWAVPKGPSLNPSVKRMALMVEDHPLEYQDFEGIIPEHNYGAGSVIIWDRGVYRHPEDKSGKKNEHLLREGLKHGDLKFVLEGQKLQGEFALVKMKKDEKAWLLLKKKDGYASQEEVLSDNRSVVSDKTLEDITADNPRQTSRQGKMDQIRLREAIESEALREAPMKPMPHNIKPMLATPIREPFDHPEWIFEMKWDGYRALAEVRGQNIILYSRNGITLNRKFAPVVDALRKFRFEALLDGEVVVVDEQGQPDFQMLQDYQKTGRGHLVYYVFDLIHLEGHALTALPLVKRKELLKKVLPSSAHVRISDHVEKDGVLFFKLVKEKGLEGIVAKHSQSSYRMGGRGKTWLKIKTMLIQDGVIAGFTQPRVGARSFGALVLGVYEGDELVFIGHTGAGFSARNLRSILARLTPLIRKQCPFRVAPRTNTPVIWVKPELVCEVIFHGWTDEGLLRQPVFSRLREDMKARQVVRERSELR